LLLLVTQNKAFDNAETLSAERYFQHISLQLFWITVCRG